MIFSFLSWHAHYITLEAANHIVYEDGKYRSTGGDPQFLMHSSRHELPHRWVTISYLAESQDFDMEPVLYVDDGNGFSELSTIILPSGNGHIEAIVRLPDHVKAIRLDPSSQTGIFSLKDVRMVQLSKFSVLWRLVKDKLMKKPLTLQRLRAIKEHLLAIYRTDGVLGLKKNLVSLVMAQPKAPPSSYGTWINAYDTIADFDRKRICERIRKFEHKPLISVIMPVYNTDERWLRFAIDSVLAQIYQNWELCIADDASTVLSVHRILAEYQLRDPRIKVVFRKSNGHISVASNSAIELATGEWIALLDHDDELPEHALYMVAEEINAHPQVRLIYSDEDRINEQGIRYNPYFKSDWNPDLFLSHNLISHLGVYHSSLVKKVNGFREGLEGSQDYDLALRIVQRIAADQIRHIPHILYHWRAVEGSVADRVDAKIYAYEAARTAIQYHLDQRKIPAYVTTAYNYTMNRVVYKLPKYLPKVSVIIPTKDKLNLLRVAVRGILDKTDYSNLELIIVDNQSKQQETLTYLNELESLSNVRVIRYDEPYNYSAINNIAVRQATGEIIALVNNDVEIIAPTWLKEMVSHALRLEIGAVGALLYYTNDTIQHAGILLCSDVALHAYQYLNRSNPGCHGKASLLQNYSAVTAACMVLRRAIFDEVGGFDEKNLPIAYNDVDLCLRIQEKGYRILWTPYAELYHHESASLGPPEAPERRAQFSKEVAYVKKRWKHIIEQDPFHNPNLMVNGSEFSLAFPPRSSKPWRMEPKISPSE